jgi:hypothetical protein
MRTTIDIDDPILCDLKRLRQREGKSLGRLVSDLLAHSLTTQRSDRALAHPFQWTSRPMMACVGPSDKDALLDAMDEGRP